MHIKLIMLPSDADGKKLCGYAEDILNEISGAFGHTILINYDKIGQDSVEAYGDVLTEETVDACKKCDAVLVGNAYATGLEELYDACDIPLIIRFCGVPEAFCGKHEKAFSLWNAVSRSLDEETVHSAFQSALDLAEQEDLPLSYVVPNGKSQDTWMNTVAACNSTHPRVVLKEFSATQAIASLIEAPSQLGVLLSPPYVGAVFQTAATKLNTVPSIIHDSAYTEKIGIYSPYIIQSGTEMQPSPIGMILALANLLRYSLHLFKEADCVEAAVKNILEAGWRTSDMLAPGTTLTTAENEVQLICEQIALAGELLSGKGGIV